MSKRTAYATCIIEETGGNLLCIVPVCPFCGERHVHGFSPNMPYRVPHCHERPEWAQGVEYKLVPANADEFPLFPKQRKTAGCVS